MAICAVRIDERLIHGQVATAWCKAVGATRIMIIDDDVVKDPLQKMALKSAVPVGMKLSLLTIEKAAENLKTDKYDGQNVFIVVKKPEVIEALVHQGVDIQEVIVGNMAAKEGSKVLYRTVSITVEDEKAFKNLIHAGTLVHLQMVPKDKKVNIGELL